MRTLWIPFLLLVVLFSCRKEENPVLSLPEVITLDIYDIRTTTAMCGGNITSDGGSDIVACGVVWHTDSVPGVDNKVGITIDDASAGSFTSNISNLKQNTVYYVRAYATNSVGTSYGKVVMFMTSGRVPDITPRHRALADYYTNYLGSVVDNPGWTGHTAGCNSGTLPDDIRKMVLQRLNYFRRLVGLSDNITENIPQHQGCQAAALMFKANNNLSQYPPQTWSCWTQAGYAAANGSNIAWSSATSGEFAAHTTNSISAFIQDAGSHNNKIPHRSWFFMPGLTMLGIGSTNSTSCMQWNNNYNLSGPAPEFIAYPPAGYIPSVITFPKWSFTLPGGADFTNASVSMTDGNGINISLNVINKPDNPPGSLPLEHLVWEPAITPSTFTTDMKFTVTITNILGAPQSSYTYEVIVMQVTGGF